MSQLIPYANNTVTLSTDKGFYRLDLSQIVSVGIPQTSGVLHPSYLFVVRYQDNRQILVEDVSTSEVTKTHELLLAHWESFNRHDRVYENSTGAPMTKWNDKHDKVVVAWGSNTVQLFVSEIEGVKEISKAVVVYYRNSQATTFMSDKPEYLTRLKQGIDTLLRQ